MTQSVTENGTRGPAVHNVRAQIVDAAMQHFAHYGYKKITVSDLARAIGFSKAYIYNFFESKQAIGEVICSNRLAMIIQRAEAAIADAPEASEQLRRLFRTLSATGTELFFTNANSMILPPSHHAIAGRQRWLMKIDC